jgi:membrane protease YdiL (CAAX protease family)
MDSSTDSEQPLAPEPAAVVVSSPEQDSVPESTAHKIFYGPFGLRAGWSLLIYCAIVVSFVIGINLIGHQIKHQREHAAAVVAAKTGKPAVPVAPLAPNPNPSEPQPLASMIIVEAVVFGIFLLLSLLMAKIEHRKLSAFGLGGIHSVSRTLIGALWGIISISLLIGALRAFHFLTFDSLLDHGPKILLFGALQLLGFFLVGLTEEYSMRGYLQFTLTRGMVSLGNRISPRHARAIGFWIASLFTSVLFFYLHTRNPGETPLGLFQVFLAGMLFIVALWRTGSLWWGIGFHCTWDWGQSFLYGTPDSGGLIQGRLFATHASGNPLFSGGTTGPEGSVLCIPILLFAIAILFFTRPSPLPALELPATAHPPELPPEPTPIYTESPPAIA